MGNWQERSGLPSTSTVHEPQNPSPHPNLVPVSPSSVRRTQRSMRSSSTSSAVDVPLNEKRIGLAMQPPGSTIGIVGEW